MRRTKFGPGDRVLWIAEHSKLGDFVVTQRNLALQRFAEVVHAPALNQCVSVSGEKKNACAKQTRKSEPDNVLMRRADRVHILAAKREDAALSPQGEPLTPGGDRERKRKQYRQPGVTGEYRKRRSRKGPDAGPDAGDDVVWTWYARCPPFKGKTVGEWRREAQDQFGCLDAKYALLRGADADPVVRGTREEVLAGTAHITKTSGRLMFTDLRRNEKTGTVVSVSKSNHSRRHKQPTEAICADG